jgi:glycogen debranching enzyme
LLRQTVNKIRDEEGLLGIVDIVLNHVAFNSAWIVDHPDACFSTEIVPRLWPAWLVDETF